MTYNTLTGTPIDSIQYQSVGVILQVTPFITDNNLVEMIVNPQISSLSRPDSDHRRRRRRPGHQSPLGQHQWVVTPDGQTVVIGGLMEHDKTSIVSKIPLLGDIPGLGALFRRTQKDNTKTELMIFLTPHVVAAPSQLASVSAREAGKAELSPKAFDQQELNKYLETLPFKQPAKR